MRTLAFGDIHGCHTALQTLLDYVKPAPRDQLVFLGDYIDRGPNAKGVIQWMLDRGCDDHLICLRGNHEVMMLEARNDPLRYRFWSSFGGIETLLSYVDQPCDDWPQSIPASHWEFLERTKNWYETETHIFVHASVKHDVAMEDQNERDLFWERCTGMDPHESGKKVICGHTPQAFQKPEVYPFGVCLDTGVYSNGWLTCLDVGSGDYWQANELGATYSDKLELA